jgi:hypothetical protein
MEIVFKGTSKVTNTERPAKLLHPLDIAVLSSFFWIIKQT